MQSGQVGPHQRGYFLATLRYRAYPSPETEREDYYRSPRYSPALIGSRNLNRNPSCAARMLLLPTFSATHDSSISKHVGGEYRSIFAANKGALHVADGCKGTTDCFLIAYAYQRDDDKALTVVRCALRRCRVVGQCLVQRASAAASGGHHTRFDLPCSLHSVHVRVMQQVAHVAASALKASSCRAQLQCVEQIGLHRPV